MPHYIKLHIRFQWSTRTQGSAYHLHCVRTYCTAVGFQYYFLAYRFHNTKHIRYPLDTANVNSYWFWGTFLLLAGLKSSKPANQRNKQDCGSLKFRSCYFSNLTRLDCRGESVFISEKFNSTLVYTLYFPLHFNTFKTWCDFDRASSLICGNKMQTRCNRGFYCRSYWLLKMFRASLCPSSGAQEYYTVVAACGISCCKNVKNKTENTNSTKKLTKLFFTFLQHEIPQAATTV